MGMVVMVMLYNPVVEAAKDFLDNFCVSDISDFTNYPFQIL